MLSFFANPKLRLFYYTIYLCFKSLWSLTLDEPGYIPVYGQTAPATLSCSCTSSTDAYMSSSKISAKSRRERLPHYVCRNYLPNSPLFPCISTYRSSLSKWGVTFAISCNWCLVRLINLFASFLVLVDMRPSCTSLIRKSQISVKHLSKNIVHNCFALVKAYIAIIFI